MRKWILEIVLAFTYKKQLATSFRNALRFVRCDYITQMKIAKFLGKDEDYPGRS
jgi:hypothetical protein